MDYYKLGQQIRKYRKILNMSQEQLAEAIGISVTHMSHIETGNTKLSLQVFVDISKVLNVSTDDLLTLNIVSCEKQYAELLTILETSSPQETRIITDTIKAIKLSLEKYLEADR